MEREEKRREGRDGVVGRWGEGGVEEGRRKGKRGDGKMGEGEGSGKEEEGRERDESGERGMRVEREGQEGRERDRRGERGTGGEREGWERDRGYQCFRTSRLHVTVTHVHCIADVSSGNINCIVD